MTKTKPLFMWAGGKSKMLKHYADIERPVGYDTYIEPFFGGGAVFLNESPQKSIINDINPEIVSIYHEVKDNPEVFIKGVTEYANEYLAQTDRKQYYYGLRSAYWAEQTPELLYTLMRLGFNGIWQTCKASNGLFGTPAGLLNQVRVEQIIDQDNVMDWSQRLQNTEILSMTFDDVNVPPNSFVYLDPPYRGSFTTYGTVFGDVEQQQVIDYALRASEHSTVWLANRSLEGDTFFEDRLPQSKFFYFDVTYTAGRRKKTDDGYEALKAREFLCII